MDKNLGLKDDMRFLIIYANTFFNKNHSKCQKCGWGEINPVTKLVPLQIHHIDGDCLNNDEKNLELLCPNCHSLTETYGSLNVTSSRTCRKQKSNKEII